MDPEGGENHSDDVGERHAEDHAGPCCARAFLRSYGAIAGSYLVQYFQGIPGHPTASPPAFARAQYPAKRVQPPIPARTSGFHTGHWLWSFPMSTVIELV